MEYYEQRRHNLQMEREKRVIERYVDALLAADLTLMVRDTGGDLSRPSRNKAEIVDAIKSVDEAYLCVVSEGPLKASWIFFVLGNDPSEVVNDYTTDLEPLIEGVNYWAQTKA